MEGLLARLVHYFTAPSLHRALCGVVAAAMCMPLLGPAMCMHFHLSLTLYPLSIGFYAVTPCSGQGVPFRNLERRPLLELWFGHLEVLFLVVLLPG